MHKAVAAVTMLHVLWYCLQFSDCCCHTFIGHGFVDVLWIMHAVKVIQSCYRFACAWLVSSSCMCDHCFCDTVNIEDL